MDTARSLVFESVLITQGSVLSPLLFIIVLEALSRVFCTGCPWELLYVDDLTLPARQATKVANDYKGC